MQWCLKLCYCSRVVLEEIMVSSIFHFCIRAQKVSTFFRIYVAKCVIITVFRCEYSGGYKSFFYTIKSLNYSAEKMNSC